VIHLKRQWRNNRILVRRHQARLLRE